MLYLKDSSQKPLLHSASYRVNDIKDRLEVTECTSDKCSSGVPQGRISIFQKNSVREKGTLETRNKERERSREEWGFYGSQSP